MTPAGITAELEELKAAGIGGVEITPIYGVRGSEEHFVPYLSDEWVRLLEHTLAEARRLGLGVDMATGTGWPFGGPWVANDDAARNLVYRTYVVRGGEQLAEPLRATQEPLLRAVGTNPRGGRLQIGELIDPVEANPDLQALALDQVRFPRALPLHTVVAYSDAGEVVDLTTRVTPDRMLDWIAPAGRWTLYAIYHGWHGKMVERAAPGGEGNVIDHFAAAAIRNYLARFDRAFGNRRLEGLRAFFNDSYEVDDAAGQADWTPALFEQFQRRRGYDLRRHLPALFGTAGDDENARVLADYRETVSDLLLDTFTTEWRQWAARRQAIVRNQAHGSPANILDLYAASDIPETEGADILRFKWASSAGHVAGRPLISAEAATWLNEHFRSTLGDVRRVVDEFFLGGVNHVLYHGHAYSPRDGEWPGWLFYAAVHFNARNSWWGDFPALNGYVARVQSFLQAGRPDDDVLLYYPHYDVLTVRSPRGLLEHFGDDATISRGTAFDAAAGTLQRRGFTYDFISDRQLRNVRVTRSGLETGGNAYRVIVVPRSQYVHLATFERLRALAAEGATVLVIGSLPSDVAGFAEHDARRRRLQTLVSGITFGAAAEGVSEARVGRGRFLLTDDIERGLARAGVTREPMVDRGLQFVRRVNGGARVYFVVNRGNEPMDGWITLARGGAGATLFEPMHGLTGRTDARSASAGQVEVYLQIRPGESMVVASTPSAPAGSRYPFYRSAGAAQPLAAAWDVRFTTGGPALPSPRRIEQLASWTEFGDPATRSFSGTAAYTTRFARPADTAGAWRLDLGRVAQSARVRLNGRELATLIGPTYDLIIDEALLTATNELEVRVSNLMANRIADLDRRGIPWKKFYNVNFPPRLPDNRGPDGLFTAAGWEPLESGLLGPVTLTPLTRIGQ